MIVCMWNCSTLRMDLGLTLRMCLTIHGVVGGVVAARLLWDVLHKHCNRVKKLIGPRSLSCTSCSTLSFNNAG